MPKDDQPAADDVADQQNDVQFDKEIDVQGEVTENPIIEEVEDGAEDTTQDNASDTGAAGDSTSTTEGSDSGESADTDKQDGTTTEDNETQPTIELEVPAAPDPGEFQSKGDYSFEVTTTDGKTLKITSQAEVDAFAEALDKDPSIITASQYTKFNRGVTKMDVGLEREKANWQSEKDTFETQQADAEAQTKQIQQWSNEVKYLEAKGLIPRIDQTKDADWLANKEDPAVKERLDIFQWMEAENKARNDAGIAPVLSAVDAFSLMKAEQRETQVNDEKTAEKEQRQSKGSMVGGNAPHTPDNQPANAIIGPGGNLRDLVLEAQY